MKAYFNLASCILLITTVCHNESYAAEPQEKLNQQLEQALKKRDYQAAEAAVKRGADVNFADPRGTTLICRVANPYQFGRDLRAAKLLLRHHVRLDAKDRFGISAAGNAVWWGRVDLLKLLQQHGAKLDERVDRFGTLLHLATSQARPAVCQYLIASGLKVDSLNDSKNTPLHIACRRGWADVVAVLLKNGAKLDLVNRDGKTPRQLAEGTLARTNRTDRINWQRNNRVVDLLNRAEKTAAVNNCESTGVGAQR